MSKGNSFFGIDKKEENIKILIELKREPFYNLLREFSFIIIFLISIWFLKDSIYIFYYLYFLIFFNRILYFIGLYYFYRFSKIIKVTKIGKNRNTYIV